MISIHKPTKIPLDPTLPQKHEWFLDCLFGKLDFVHLRENCHASCSNICRIIGLVPSRRQYFNNKKNKSSNKISFYQQKLFDYGNTNEPIAARAFQNVFLNLCMPNQFNIGPTTPVTFPYLRDLRFVGTPDRLYHYTDRYTLEQFTVGLEIKCPAKRPIPMDKTHLLDIFIEYIPQCLGYCAIFNYDSWDLFFYRDAYLDTQVEPGDAVFYYSWFRIYMNWKFWEDDLWPAIKTFMDALDSTKLDLINHQLKKITANEKFKWMSKIKYGIKIELISTNLTPLPHPILPDITHTEQLLQ